MRTLLAALLVTTAALADNFNHRYGWQAETYSQSAPTYQMPQNSYVIPRLGGGYTEVYPAGSITVTEPDHFGTVNIYRHGFLPPSRY